MTKDKPTQEEIKKCAKILLSRKSKTPWEGLTEWAKGTWLDSAEWHLTELQIHLSTITKERIVYFEQDGKPIEISCDLGEAYSESALAEKVSNAFNDR